ncbi:MAG: peptidylprolyl isomerase [Phycisphaerae bacterium]
MRPVTITAIAVFMTWAALAAMNPPAERPPLPPAEPPRATSEPIVWSPPTGGDVMAYVNGRPVYMKSLTDVLVRDYGIFMAQQLIADELVRQSAADKGVTISEADVQAETDATMKRVFGQLPPAASREQMLDDLVGRMGLSKAMWEVVMHRQAMLRKLIAPTIEVSDDEVKDEFAITYDRRVVVRDFQTDTPTNADKALKQLEGIKDPKALEAKFIELVTTSSVGVTAGNGGLLPPIGAKSTNVALAVREAAMALKAPGQLSGIVQSGTTYHILLATAIEDPKNVKLEDVKARLQETIREKKVAAQQKIALEKLIDDAKKNGKVEYVDPVLKAKQAELDKAAKEGPRK